MPKTKISTMRLPRETISQLDEMAAAHETNRTHEAVKAIDRTYQEWKRESKTMKHLTIVHQYDSESMGIGAEDDEQILDIPASYAKFENMAYAAIRKAYPGADVTVEYDTNCKTTVDCNAPVGSVDEMDIRDDVQRIASDIWQDWKWLVYK